MNHLLYVSLCAKFGLLMYDRDESKSIREKLELLKSLFSVLCLTLLFIDFASVKEA